MADGETDLVALIENLGSALLTAAQALRSAADERAADNQFEKQDRYIPERGVFVYPHESVVVNIDNPLTDVELPRLRNILMNISLHAGDIWAYLNDIQIMEGEGRAGARRRSNALRLAATIRDSARQSAILLRGESLDDTQLSPSHPAMGNLTEEEFEESGYDGPMREQPNPFGIARERALEQEHDEFLSSIYQSLRVIQSNQRVNPPVSAKVIKDLELVMTRIRDRQDEKRK